MLNECNELIAVLNASLNLLNLVLAAADIRKLTYYQPGQGMY